MIRRGNQRNFDGMSVQITGEDNRLDEVLDELDYVAGVVVTGRRDMENMPDNGVLFIQCRAHSRSIVTTLAEKRGLQVM